MSELENSIERLDEELKNQHMGDFEFFSKCNVRDILISRQSYLRSEIKNRSGKFPATVEITSNGSNEEFNKIIHDHKENGGKLFFSYDLLERMFDDVVKPEFKIIT